MNESDSFDPPAWIPLEDDERVTLRAAPSRKLLLAAFAAAFVLLVGLSILVGLVDDIGAGRRLSWITVVLTVGTILYADYTVRRREYVVTDRRAAVGVGLRSKDVDEIALDAVKDVVVERATWQEWFGTGNVRLEASAGGALTFAFVERPHAVIERVLPLLESRRN